MEDRGHVESLYGADANMCGVVVLGHGPLATALLAAAVKIVGHVDDGVVALDIEENTDRDEVLAAIDSTRRGLGVVVIADLFGGTAANLALGNLGEQNVEVVTGANLAMVLEALHKRRALKDVQSLASTIGRAGRNSVVVASDLLRTAAA